MYIKKVACKCRPLFLIAGFDEVFYFFFGWHYAEGAFFGGDEGSGCVCEGEEFFQVFIGEVFEAVVKHVVQGAGAEGVAGAGGFDGVFLKEWCGFYFSAMVVCTASVFSKGDQDKGDVVFFFDESCAFIVVCSIKKEFHFVVGDLQHIAAFHAVFDLFAGVIKVFPERWAKVWIESDNTVGFFCHIKSVAGCFADAFVCG